MKNIKLEKSGEVVTIHTPHGRATVTVLGGPTVGEKRWSHNETKVEALAINNGEHFYQIGDSQAPVTVDLFPVKIRMRNVPHIQLGEADKDSPLRPLFMQVLHSNKDKKK